MGVMDQLQAELKPERFFCEKYLSQVLVLVNLIHPIGRYLCLL